MSLVTQLLNRYPFSEDEIEILLRCHESIVHVENSNTNGRSSLNTLAHSSPYSYFFLPCDELKLRIDFLAKEVLPSSFLAKFQDAIFSDAFVDYANEGEQSLEHFIEGVANCGRRGERHMG